MQTQKIRYRDPKTPDSLLVSRALVGDQDAFEALVSCYQRSLLGLIYRSIGEYHEAEDILQHVRLQLYLSGDVHVSTAAFQQTIYVIDSLPR